MNCSYCGYFNEEPTSLCGRCGADIPAPTCTQCEVKVAWGQVHCESCQTLSESADKTPCPACKSLNTVSAEYCTSCGAPMAVITRVMALGHARDREPLETWRIYGIETTMVGRASELEALEDRLRSAREQNALHIVGLSAPTGLGKSRLIAEFQRRLNLALSETVFVQAASRDDSGGPFTMFARLLKNRFYIGEKEHPATARRKFMDAVAALIPDRARAERIGHLVGHLIGMHFPESAHLPGVRDTEGAARLERSSFEALAHLLAADAAKNPLVIALEDLQYASAQSGELLEFLLDPAAEHALKDSPILMVLSWNPAELFLDDALKSIAYDQRLELSPLSDQEVRDFVQDTLHKCAEIPAQLVDKIVDAAHGNPLSVEEMLRILISQGAIDTRQSTWRIDLDKLRGVELPTTVEETVRARLATLNPDERLILEMAASVGETFWPEAVSCLYRAHLDHSDPPMSFWTDSNAERHVEAIIESLERKDMVRRRDDTQLHPAAEMYFKHRPERRSLYDDLSEEARRRHHRALAQWLKNGWETGLGAASPAPDGGEDAQLEGAIEPVDTGRVLEMIARHFDAGGYKDQAAAYYLRAARLFSERYANRKAIELFGRGLARLDDAHIAEKIHAFHDLGGLCELLGESDQALAYFREMLRYSWIIGDMAKGGVAYNKIGRAYRGLGEYNEGLRAFEYALVLFRDAEDTRGVASTLDDIGQIHRVRGEYEAALKYYLAGLQLRRELGLARSIALSLNHIGSLKLDVGELKEALVYFREALGIRKEIGDQRGVADSFNNLAALCVERGQYAQAITLFEEALELSRAIGYRTLEIIVLNNLGDILVDQGDIPLAEDTLKKALAVATTAGDKRVLFDIYRNLARVSAEKHQLEPALEQIHAALNLSEELGSRVLYGIGKFSLAEIHAIFSQVEGHQEQSRARALDAYQEASDVLEDVGSDAQLGRCLKLFGTFLMAYGEAARATDKLERAREIFKRLELKRQQDAVELQLAK